MPTFCTRLAVVLFLFTVQSVVAGETPQSPFPSVVGASSMSPNYEERVLLEWTNRARSAPDIDLAGCGTNCSEPAGCYTPMPPLYFDSNLTRAARFHSDELRLQGYFAHNSACTVVSDINLKYPATCDGSVSCACVGGTLACSPVCTSWNSRIGLFGATGSAEIIAMTSNPNSAFYLWLNEPYAGGTCAWTMQNGHRYSILKSTGPAIGFGASGSFFTGDFGNGGSASKIPSVQNTKTSPAFRGTSTSS